MPDMRLIALYLVAIFSLSQSPIWVRWSHAPIEVLGAGRLLVAALILLPFTQTKDWKAWWAQSSGQKGLLLLAALTFFAHLWTYKFASQNTSIANLTILFASNPIWMALLIRKAVSKTLIVAYSVSFLGLLILGFKQIDINSVTLPGDLLALTSSVLYSIYLFLSQKARRHCEFKVFSFNLFLAAGAAFLFTAWLREVPLFPQSQQTYAAILGLAVFSTILGHGIFVYLMTRLKLTWMSCGKLLEPILASFSALFLFGENMTSVHAISFALVGLGVSILIFKESPKEPLANRH